jgi:hypothetical protein
MISRVMILVVACACATRAEWLVSSYNDGRVTRHATDTGAFLSELVPAAASLDLPHEIFIDRDENILIASSATDEVLRYDGRSGAFMGALISAGSGGLDYPVSMLYAPDGTLLVTSQLSSEVLRYDSTNGTFLGEFVPAGSGGLNGPSDIAYGPDGLLYVAGRYSWAIYRYSAADGSFVDAFITNHVREPFGLVFDAAGDLYVGNGQTNAVLKFSGTNGALLAALSTGLSVPVEPEIGPDGEIYVASYGNSRIVRFDGATDAFLDNFVTSGVSGCNYFQWRPDPDPAFEAWKSNRFSASHMTQSVFTADHADPDGDTHVNRDEYIADTDPLVVTSFFPRAVATGSGALHLFTVGASSTGRLYEVYARSSLASTGAWQASGAAVAGTGSNVTLAVTNEGQRMVYRTGVRLP